MWCSLLGRKGGHSLDIRVACWIRKVKCTQAHAHAPASEQPHARTHAYAAIVSPTRLDVTLHLHCLSCLTRKPIVNSEPYFVLHSPVWPT